MSRLDRLLHVGLAMAGTASAVLAAQSGNYMAASAWAAMAALYGLRAGLMQATS